MTSCIEFEREKIQYRHDASADQLRMTLRYVGIYGGKGSSFSNDEREEPHDPKKLNAQQKEQMESVLKGGRAFFFENWIFEYDRPAIRDTLTKSKNGEWESADLPFGKPEKKFLQAALQDVELTNLGFYRDEDQRLCGEQTLVIKRFTNFLETANEVIRRQVVHGIARQQAKVEAGKFQPEDAPSEETALLLKNACSKKHDFLLMEKGRIVVRVPLGQREYLEFKKEILDKKPNPGNDKSLPAEITTTYRNKMLTLILGEGKQAVATLTKKCFAGYSDNALLYLREKHPKLLREKARIMTQANQFLTGGD